MDAVATPLAGVLPSALTGSYSYIKEGIADWRIGLAVGGGGALMGVFGAVLATELGGTIVMVGTALVLIFSAAQTFFAIYKESKDPATAQRPESDEAEAGATAPTLPVVERSRANYLKAIGIGVFAGLYGGFFGLGGGVIIVPALNRFLRMSYKQAIGTSLLSITLISVPALAMHAYLGNVNWLLALGLIVGVIPGAWLGAKITIGASERATSIGFALLLTALGLWLGIAEMLGIG